MTAFLASVMSAAEAEVAVQGGADIIDFKNPNDGALGALPDTEIRAGVKQVAARRRTSATVGDLPMDPGVVAQAVERIGGLGVDFVKVGLFPGGDRRACLEVLGAQASRGLAIVAVLFADLAPDFEVIEDLAAQGVKGIMVDTANKDAGRLSDFLDEATLNHFLSRSRAAGLFTGLAGSLTAGDVVPLLGLAPDYLGFRGALTTGGRNATLDLASLAVLRRLIPVQTAGHGASIAKSATAVAGAQ
jgi:dihydroneopterin aldolase